MLSLAVHIRRRQNFEPSAGYVYLCAWVDELKGFAIAKMKLKLDARHHLTVLRTLAESSLFNGTLMRHRVRNHCVV
jgi:hypothetical protein